MEQDYPLSLINLIFSDNGSMDSTGEKLLNFQAKNRHVFKSIEIFEVPRIEEKGKFSNHSNITNCINALLKSSRTDVITLGSDCFPPKDGIAKLLNMIQNNGADISAGITLTGGAETMIGYKYAKGLPIISAYMWDNSRSSFTS